MTVYATLIDAESRYPAELITLAADEQTGVRDDARIESALADASSEIRGILKARYSLSELGRLDADSLGTLRIYCIEMALYRVALSFARSTERIKDGYDAAVKRLEAIAQGRGGLSFDDGGDGGPGSPGAPGAAVSPNEVLIDAPETRMFSRARMRGL